MNTLKETSAASVFGGVFIGAQNAAAHKIKQMHGELKMNSLIRKMKKNNKGFSLIELIVVVLIIAVLAVAIAPQVVRYVGISRDNVSLNNRMVIKSAVQAALAEYQGEGGALPAEGKTITFTVAKDNSSIGESMSTTDDSITDELDDLKECAQANIGSDKLDKDYTVSIDSSGTVSVTTPTE
jgi:prepilin-type N-terminal cleavage/methylation domain-containing protein